MLGTNDLGNKKRERERTRGMKKGDHYVPL